jgi:hypothetical protein
MTATEEELAGRFERLPALVNEDAALVRRGAWLSAPFEVRLGALPYHVVIEKGRVVGLERGPLLMRSWRFAIHATAEAWQRFWVPVPEPGWHDFFAMAKRGVARVEGDLHPFMANLQYVKDVLASPRRPNH